MGCAAVVLDVQDDVEGADLAECARLEPLLLAPGELGGVAVAHRDAGDLARLFVVAQLEESALNPVIRVRVAVMGRRSHYTGMLPHAALRASRRACQRQVSHVTSSRFVVMLARVAHWLPHRAVALPRSRCMRYRGSRYGSRSPHLPQ